MPLDTREAEDSEDDDAGTGVLASLALVLLHVYGVLKSESDEVLQTS
jgi:hypothetical protein